MLCTLVGIVSLSETKDMGDFQRIAQILRPAKTAGGMAHTIS